MKLKLARAVGNTPLIKITEKLYGKLETANPSGSVKDRLVVYIVESALRNNELSSRTKLIEATSGNTGISLCMVGADLGLPVTIIMPSDMSEERRQMMNVFGANIIDSPPGDFEAAINLKKKMMSEDSDYWSPNQFSNLNNIECHFLTTAHEIHKQAGPNWSAFIHGAGTGGTIMGVQKYIETFGLNVKTCLVIPAEDKHGIQGIGDGQDFLVNRSCLDDVYMISTNDAVKRTKKLAKETGLLVGISSGANVLASERWIKQNDPAGVVITMLCDRGERYMSILNREGEDE
jgi:cysteine synthase A